MGHLDRTINEIADITDALHRAWRDLFGDSLYIETEDHQRLLLGRFDPTPVPPVDDGFESIFGGFAECMGGGGGMEFRGVFRGGDAFSSFVDACKSKRSTRFMVRSRGECCADNVFTFSAIATGWEIWPTVHEYNGAALSLDYISDLRQSI